MTPDELLTTTRTVRKRLDVTRPVPLDLIRECLSIALQAPSGSNQQNWHWLVITDADTRFAMAELYRKSHLEYRAASPLLEPLDDPEREVIQRRVMESADYLREHLAEVPVLLIPCLRGELPEGNQAGFWASLLPAVWNYMLAARARGLGTAWTTLHLKYEREAAGLLGLPDDVHQAALVPTAYYTGETFRQAPRLPLDEVLHLDRW